MLGGYSCLRYVSIWIWIIWILGFYEILDITDHPAIIRQQKLLRVARNSAFFKATSEYPRDHRGEHTGTEGPAPRTSMTRTAEVACPIPTKSALLSFSFESELCRA